MAVQNLALAVQRAGADKSDRRPAIGRLGNCEGGVLRRDGLGEALFGVTLDPPCAVGLHGKRRVPGLNRLEAQARALEKAIEAALPVRAQAVFHEMCIRDRAIFMS